MCNILLKELLHIWHTDCGDHVCCWAERVCEASAFSEFATCHNMDMRSFAVDDKLISFADIEM